MYEKQLGETAMGAFDRARKLNPLGRRKNSSNSSSDDFDFDELEGMSDEFEDSHDAGSDRKSTIKSYIKDHYSSKINDRQEQKRLLKATLPANYSGAIDLGSDLKDDFDDIRYQMGKEWERQSTGVKKLLKGFEGQLKFLKLNKLVNYANSSSRGGYSDEPVDQNEALVANLLGDFPGRSDPKQQQIQEKVKAKEKEAEAEYRSKTLQTQLRGTVSGEASVAELRKLTNYQDQVTYIYQKKSLEIQIRSFVEHKTQTELLRTYKDESIAELKEIHKNTGLPEAVKINQSEFAAQIFKEKMMGNVANWFDGNVAPLRKRVTTKIKDKLLNMTKEFGSSIESFVSMSDADGDQGGGGMARLLLQMGADNLLDNPYNRATNSLTGKLRNKLASNQKINKFGRGAKSLVSGMGSNINNMLLTGETGNSLGDSLIDFFGLRQAAIQKSGKLRGSLAQNLDTAAYMDVKFKQTVERVIPGWLSLIYKETHLTRLGRKDDKGYEAKEWDWKQEDFRETREIKAEIKAKIFNRDKVIEYAAGMEDLLIAYGSMGLTSTAKEKLRNWLRKRIGSSMNISAAHIYHNRETIFGKDAGSFELIANYHGHLNNLTEDETEFAAANDMPLRMQGGKYAEWMTKIDNAHKQMTGLDVMDRATMQQLANEGYGKLMVEIGAASYDDDGSISINEKMADGIAEKYGRRKHKQTVFFKDGESRQVRGRSVSGTEIDESKTDPNYEDALYDEYTMDNNKENQEMNKWMTNDVLAQRRIREAKAALVELLTGADTMTSGEATERGLDRYTRASGGYIPSYAGGGGPTGDDLKVDDEIHVKMHGKEFVTDKQTTEKNRRLLEFMNKFKAPVVMPDGSVNPIYYRAFGFKSEQEFLDSDTDTSLSMEQNKFFKGIKKHASENSNESAYGMITELFSALDLARISDKDLKTLSDPKVKPDAKFKLFLELRKKHAKPKRTTSSLLGAGIAGLRDLSEGKGKNSEKIENAKKSIKGFYQNAKEQILKLTDEQADELVNKALGTLDADSISDANMEILTDPATSSKDKALLIAKLSAGRSDKADVAKKLLTDTFKKAKTSAKGKLKNLINGGDGKDTTNTDNLKAIGDKLGGKAKQGKDYAKSKMDIIKALAEGGQLDEKSKEYANKLLVKLRMDKAAGYAQKLWKDQPVDVYLTDQLDFPRLNVFGFANGAYVDKETGRVLTSHHDINGPVDDKKGDSVLSLLEIEKGLVDKDGNPIFINALKRLRNQAKEQATLLYNKYGKKHVNKAADSFLTMAEKWQGLFKNTAIDLYMGEGTEPRLTAIGFKEGKYISFKTKRKLAGYNDIDGAVEAYDASRMIITTEELQSTPLVDKEGNVIKPPKLMSALGRVGSLIAGALSFDKAYGAGKKGLGKLKAYWKKLRDEKKNDDEFVGPRMPDDPTNPENHQPMTKGWFGGKMAKIKGALKGEDGKPLRVGSWQWKRKKKEEDSWMSKLGGMFGGNKDKEGETKKKGILGKLLGVVGTIAGGIFTLGNKLGSIIGGSVLGAAKWLVPKLGANLFKALGWIAKPILASLAFIGKKVGGGLGRLGGGGLARIGGLAAGGYMMHSAMKGSPKLDENGNPVMDANGEAVTEVDKTGLAMGAATTAASLAGRGTLTMLGRGAMALGTAARIGAGILSGPVGWAALGATAAWYGGKWALGKWNKGKAAKDSPMQSFRINQYGFDMTDEKTMSTLMQLESVLLPNVVIQGEKATFKTDMDVESVFGVFGLKFSGGDQERNKQFLTWFLGRFKPIYLAYIRSMNAIKKKSDISNIDKDLTASQRLEMLDKVHFKNQMDMNPYNIKVSPFEDPNETNYDFEDMVDKYEDIKEILSEKASTEMVAAAGAVAGAAVAGKEGAKKEEGGPTASTVAKGLLMATPVGGIVAGSVWALKKLSEGAGDIFNTTVSGWGKSMAGFVDGMMAKVSAGWDKMKSIGSSVVDGVSSAASTAGGVISQAAQDTGLSGAWDAGVGAFEKITGKAADTQKAVYQSFLRAGLSPNQAKAITAEVGRENDYNSNVIFGSHIDPAARGGAAVKNLGMISWNGPRGLALAELLKKRGLMSADGKMANNQAALDTQTQFAVSEMKGAYAGKLKHFWENPNADPETFAEELGKKYVVWAYGQDDIPAVGGGRKKFDWKAHDNKRKKYLSALSAMGGVGTPSQSTGVMKADATTGGAGSGAPAAVKAQGGAMATAANKSVTGAAPKPLTGAALLTAGPLSGAAKGVPVTPAGTAAKSTPVSKTQVNPGGALGNLLAKCSPDLIEMGKTHCSLNKGGKSKVTLQGMNETFMKLFYAMIGEAKKKGLGSILITEGVRDLAEQKRLYDLYKNHGGALAAYPGKSLHGFGHAMDINTPNADALDKAGLLAKYGFTRPLMRMKNGKRTEQWHIENRNIPRTGVPSPSYAPAKAAVVSSTTSASPSTQNVSYQDSSGKITNTPSSNPAISGVMQSGGFSSTSNVSSAQRNDSSGMTATNNILQQSLNVQTVMRDTLIEIKNHFIKPGGKSEMDQLKKRTSPENIGTMIGEGVAISIAERLGLNKAVDKPKPAAVISASK